MKRITLFILTAVAAITFAACGGTADNKPANAANANTAKPAAAAPTKEALVALEKTAFEAWQKKDGKFFEGFLTAGFVSFDEKGRIDKAGEIKRISENKCEVKSFSLSDEQMTALGTDAVLLTLKATTDNTCDGKKQPSPSWSATVFVRTGDAWKAAYHNEIPVADPKAAPAKPAPAKPAAETKPVTDAKPADAATEALMAIEKKGWEAWKNRDAKAIEGILAKDLSIIDSGSRYDYAGTMKLWFESKCEIKSYSLSDAASVPLAKDVSILTFKGAASGTCEGQPLGTMWATSIYVKDGESWKLAFVFNAPA